MESKGGLFVRCSLLFSLLLLTSFGAGAKATPDSEGQFVGTIGSASHPVVMAALVKIRVMTSPWSQQDFHAKGYAILTNARSARITETLLLSPAQIDSRCAICHSPFQSVAPERLSSSAHVDEGVSCETCHNAARTGLRGHTRPDGPTRCAFLAGMRDLAQFTCAQIHCVAYHQLSIPTFSKPGTRIVFELDGVSR